MHFLVLVHRQLGVNRFHGFQGDGDDDEECGAAYGDRRDAGDAFEDERQDREDAEEECADDACAYAHFLGREELVKFFHRVSSRLVERRE